MGGLAADFNSTENVRPRTVLQLRKLWDNLKQRWKNEKARQIRDAMATGGPPSKPMDERLSQIEATVPHLSERVDNTYDSDRVLPSLPGDRVEDIITNMTQDNAEDSDDDRTIELNSSDLPTDTLSPSSPVPADRNEGPSEPAQPTITSQQQTSLQTRGTTTETGQETAASRRALLQQTLSTEFDSRLQALQELRLQKLAEHEVRMRIIGGRA
ncbi:hypothetical protein MTO96_038871 [Rhipicephalus appendiculatus]